MQFSVVLSKSIGRVKQKLGSKFIRNLGWLGGAEAINRLFRLLTTVILARFLTPYDFGLAALVLTSYEFTQVFTRFGIGAKVIQAEAEDLESTCNGAYCLNWLVCLGLFLSQCLISFPVAWFYHDSRIVVPLCVLATVYLVTPFGRIQSLLIQRENRLKITAATNVIQLSTASILTALFAVLGMGMWAIILPRLLVIPIGVIVSLNCHSWRPQQRFTTERWGEITSFGTSILAGSLLNTLRDNLDYLIVGRFLGVQELGIYYFAFNAGLGISLSITNAITTALYPHLCAVRRDLRQIKKRYFESLKTIACIIIPSVFLQSSLAVFYVPIIFGEKWKIAIPVLILICLSAIPRPFYLATYQLLTAIGKPNLFLKSSLAFTVIFALALIIGVHWHTFGVAVAVLLTHILIMPILIIWAGRYVFSSYHSDPLIKAS